LNIPFAIPEIPPGVKLLARNPNVAKYRIRIQALCVFRNDGRILVACLHDPGEDKDFYRPLGGGVKFGESAAKAMLREIDEELGTPVEDLTLLGVLENRFTYDGKPGHEILFIFDARFSDQNLYQLKHVPALEGAGRSIRTKWINPFKKNRKTPLYPEGLAELLKESKEKGI
jgi:ADP-ribose pyrophosphatase YjhB (NUDIX family)